MRSRVFITSGLALTAAAIVTASGGAAEPLPSPPSGDALERWQGRVVSRASLNVRDNEASTRARLVRSLLPGSAVEIACVDQGEKIFGVSDWYLLYTDYTHRAFVSAKYVEVDPVNVPITCDEAYALGLD